MPPVDPMRRFTKPYEARRICVLSASEANGTDHRFAGMHHCSGGSHAHYTRSRVAEAVAKGEMRWVGRFHNQATFTVAAAGTWQKTRSGPVATMQMKVGLKGRYIPSTQMDVESSISAMG